MTASSFVANETAVVGKTVIPQDFSIPRLHFYFNTEGADTLVPGLTYVKIGDYYYPEYDPEKVPHLNIGRYGRMYQRYLHECRYDLWGQLTLSGEIWERMAEINAICNEQMEYLINEIAKREGVTETLKKVDPMAWVGYMNNIRHRAEEIVLHDYLYAD